MFKLTKQEQLLVAFVVGAMLVGAAVKHWRAQHEPTPLAEMETKGR